MFEGLAERGATDSNIELHRSFTTLRVEIRSSGESEFLDLDREGIKVSANPDRRAADIVLSASRDAWQEYRGAAPRPGFQALSTMRRTGQLEVSGDLLAYHQHLLLLEMLFRPQMRAAKTAPAMVGKAYIEPVLGRYLHLDLDGRAHRIYFEEAGQGIPLLCLHTAGADGRQFRALLNDAEVTKHYRVVAFDLPWHGKSSPPVGFESEVYKLTTDRYVDTVMAVKRALGLNDPVVMGCSIGGRAVLHLAARHADELRGVVGLQSALYAEDRTGNTEDGSRMVLHRPDVHGGKIAGALMNGVMAPQSPAAERWETMWHYMQGGPGVFLGDLHYYFTDGDLRNGGASAIDPSRCPVYLLSGEYDPSATPEMGQALADAIGATHFEVMKEMGHFPMSENPQRFRSYLMPVLDRIRANSG